MVDSLSLSLSDVSRERSSRFSDNFIVLFKLYVIVWNLHRFYLLTGVWFNR